MADGRIDFTEAPYNARPDFVPTSPGSGTDWSLVLQQAIDDAIAAKKTLYIPGWHVATPPGGRGYRIQRNASLPSPTVTGTTVPLRIVGDGESVTNLYFEPLATAGANRGLEIQANNKVTLEGISLLEADNMLTTPFRIIEVDGDGVLLRLVQAEVSGKIPLYATGSAYRIEADLCAFRGTAAYVECKATGQLAPQAHFHRSRFSSTSNDCLRVDEGVSLRLAQCEMVSSGGNTFRAVRIVPSELTGDYRIIAGCDWRPEAPGLMTGTRTVTQITGCSFVVGPNGFGVRVLGPTVITACDFLGKGGLHGVDDDGGTGAGDLRILNSTFRGSFSTAAMRRYSSSASARWTLLRVRMGNLHASTSPAPATVDTAGGEWLVTDSEFDEKASATLDHLRIRGGRVTLARNLFRNAPVLLTAELGTVEATMSDCRFVAGAELRAAPSASTAFPILLHGQANVFDAPSTVSVTLDHTRVHGHLVPRAGWEGSMSVVSGTLTIPLNHDTVEVAGTPNIVSMYPTSSATNTRLFHGPWRLRTNGFTITTSASGMGTFASLKASPGSMRSFLLDSITRQWREI